ncbi:MAG: TlpA family protein disulfide reductase [Calditrichaeota bacterium]|nr:TlpA family protein disulfide reductase [Calditrichota bacterium]
MKRVLLVIFVLQVFLISASFAAKAPDFKFKSLDGKEVSLSDFKDKVVIVNFWATWCGPCIHEMPDLQKLSEKYKEKGLQVLGLTLQSRPNQIPEKVKSTGVTYPILLDTEPAVEKFGGFNGIPQTFIIDRNGEIVEQITGPRSFKQFEKKILKLLPEN